MNPPGRARESSSRDTTRGEGACRSTAAASALDVAAARKRSRCPRALRPLPRLSMHLGPPARCESAVPRHLCPEVRRGPHERSARRASGNGRSLARWWRQRERRFPARQVPGVRSRLVVSGVARRAVTLCKRVASDRNTNREGVTFFCAPLHGSIRRTSRPCNASTPTRSRRGARRCVSRRARRAAAPRGRPRRSPALAGSATRTSTRNGDRTLPIEGRACLARAITSAVGENVVCDVPGCVWREEGSRGWWTLAGAPGLVVPVRDIEGHVHSDPPPRTPCDGTRYLYMTSAKRGGPSAASVVHVPLEAAALRASAQRLRPPRANSKLTQRPRSSGAPVVSIPGVGSWASGVDLALAWGVRDVAVALHMDARSNIRVARALRCIVQSTAAADGFAVAVWVWDSRSKGLDNYLAAQVAGATHAT